VRLFQLTIRDARETRDQQWPDGCFPGEVDQLLVGLNGISRGRRRTAE
jgi:hypothetical protein